MPTSDLPTERPSDPAKRHSAALTDGPDRAGARAMLKAIGFTDEDLAKPLIGVATTWIETMPCNFNQRRLATFVKEGIRAAGGTPMEFNTVSVSDGAATSADIAAFLSSWLFSVVAADATTDFNDDGVVNSSDISGFLTAWLDAVQNGC